MTRWLAAALALGLLLSATAVAHAEEPERVCYGQRGVAADLEGVFRAIWWVVPLGGELCVLTQLTTRETADSGVLTTYVLEWRARLWKPPIYLLLLFRDDEPVLLCSAAAGGCWWLKRPAPPSTVPQTI